MKPTNLDAIVEQVGGKVTAVFENLDAASVAPQEAFAEVFPTVIALLGDSNPNISDGVESHFS